MSSKNWKLFTQTERKTILAYYNLVTITLQAIWQKWHDQFEQECTGAQTNCHVIIQTNSKKNKKTITPSLIMSAMIIYSGLQRLPHMSLWIWRGAVIKLMLEGVAFPFFTCSYLLFSQSQSRNSHLLWERVSHTVHVSLSKRGSEQINERLDEWERVQEKVQTAIIVSSWWCQWLCNWV